MHLNNIRWGVTLSYVSLSVNIILSILYTPIMLRILGQSEHGLYSTVSSTMSWLSLLGLGIGSSYIYYFSRYKTKQDSIAIASLNGLFLIIFFVIGIICLICGIFISYHLHLIFSDGMTAKEYTIARTLAIIVSIDMAIGFPFSVFGAVINAHERYIQSMTVALFQNICTPLLTFPLLLSGYGSIGMVATTTIVDFFAYSFKAFYCFHCIHMKVRFNRFESGIIKGIFRYSVFIALNSLIAQFATGLDKMFITRYVNTAAASIYAIGCSLYHYYSSFSGTVSGFFVTRIQMITAELINDKLQLKKRLTEQFIKLGRIQFFIQMMMLTGIIFFGRAFIHFWAERGGQDYSMSYSIALILCTATTIPLIQNIGVTIQRAQNKHKFRTIFYGIMTTINVILTIYLCKMIGTIGAAIGTAVSTVLMDVIVMNFFYHRYLYLDIIAFWKSIFVMSKGLIVPVLLGIAINYLIICDTIHKFIVNVILYTVVYCISMWLWGIGKEEKDLFSSILHIKI